MKYITLALFQFQELPKEVQDQLIVENHNINKGNEANIDNPHSIDNIAITLTELGNWYTKTGIEVSTSLGLED